MVRSLIRGYCTDLLFWLVTRKLEKSGRKSLWNFKCNKKDSLWIFVVNDEDSLKIRKILDENSEL